MMNHRNNSMTGIPRASLLRPPSASATTSSSSSRTPLLQRSGYTSLNSEEDSCIQSKLPKPQSTFLQKLQKRSINSSNNATQDKSSTKNDKENANHNDNKVPPKRRSSILRRCTPTNNQPTPSKRRSILSKRPSASADLDDDTKSAPPPKASAVHHPQRIQVAVRMRPLNDTEKTRTRGWQVDPDNASVSFTNPGTKTYTYDKVFGETSTNQQVYDTMVRGMVGSFLQGISSTVFCYGQTSSGKTFTMQGSGTIQHGSTHEKGILHMAALDMFNIITQNTEREFTVHASFLEIYNEDVFDLLAPGRKLTIQEDGKRNVVVDAVQRPVVDMESFMSVLFQGEGARSIASTTMNERSSRSHTIVRVTVKSRKRQEQEDDVGPYLESSFNLVDLAGSESVRNTGATGERLREGNNINQSLSTLSRVITHMGSQKHVGFRDSKLTHLLKSSLDGNSLITMIVCASPSELYSEETRSTLLFAEQAKKQKTHAKAYEILDDRSKIQQLKKEVASLQEELSKAKEAKSDRPRLPNILKLLSMLEQDLQSASNSIEQERKRPRHSDSFLYHSNSPLTMQANAAESHTMTPGRKRARTTCSEMPGVDGGEPSLLRKGLAVQGETLKTVKDQHSALKAQTTALSLDFDHLLSEHEKCVDNLQRQQTECQKTEALAQEVQEQLTTVAKENTDSKANLELMEQAREFAEQQRLSAENKAEATAAEIKRLKNLQRLDQSAKTKLELGSRRFSEASIRPATFLTTRKTPLTPDPQQNRVNARPSDQISLLRQALVTGSQKLKNELSVSVEEVALLQTKVGKLQNEIQNASDEAVVELSTELAALAHEYEEKMTALQSELEATKSQLHSRDDSLRDIEQQLLESQSRAENMIESNLMTLQEQNELHEHLEEADTEKEKLRTTLNQTIEERDALKGEFDAAVAEMKDLRAEMETTNGQVAARQAERIEELMAANASEKRRLEHELKSRIHERDEAAAKHTSLAEELDRSQKCHILSQQSLEQSQSTVTSLRLRLEQLSQEHSTAQASNISLQDSLQRMEQEQTRVVSERDCLRKELENSKLLISSLQEDLIKANERDHNVNYRKVDAASNAAAKPAEPAVLSNEATINQSSDKVNLPNSVVDEDPETSLEPIVKMERPPTVAANEGASKERSDSTIQDGKSPTPPQVTVIDLTGSDEENSSETEEFPPIRRPVKVDTTAPFQAKKNNTLAFKVVSQDNTITINGIKWVLVQFESSKQVEWKRENKFIPVMELSGRPRRRKRQALEGVREKEEASKPKAKKSCAKPKKINMDWKEKKPFITNNIPDAIKSTFCRVGFAKIQSKWEPVQCLGPYQIHGEARADWLKAFEKYMSQKGGNDEGFQDFPILIFPYRQGKKFSAPTVRRKDFVAYNDATPELQASIAVAKEKRQKALIKAHEQMMQDLNSIEGGDDLVPVEELDE